MKKRTLSAGVLTAMMLFSPIAGNNVEASTLAKASTQQVNQKIMWGNGEVTATQIGKITFNTGVKIYKMVNGVEKFHLVAKKGSGWRVHGLIKDNKNRTYYDLGGGVSVLQSKLSKFEAVPTSIVKKQVEKFGAKVKMPEPDFILLYPQVSRLASKAVEDEINEDIEYNFHNKMNSQATSSSYTMVQNSNNRLSFLVEYKGIDEGNRLYEEIRTYDLTTGELLDITRK